MTLQGEEGIQNELSAALEQGRVVDAVTLQIAILGRRIILLMAKAKGLDKIEGATWMAPLMVDAEAIDTESSNLGRQHFEVEALLKRRRDSAKQSELASQYELMAAAIVIRALNDFEDTSPLEISADVSALSGAISKVALAGAALGRADILSEMVLSGEIDKLGNKAQAFLNRHEQATRQNAERSAWHDPAFGMLAALTKVHGYPIKRAIGVVMASLAKEGLIREQPSRPGIPELSDHALRNAKSSSRYRAVEDAVQKLHANMPDSASVPEELKQIATQGLARARKYAMSNTA